MSNYTLKTITKLNGPLSRIYGAQVFNITISEYIKWRTNCGYEYEIDLLVNGNVVTATETYVFSSMPDLTTFLNNILTSENPTLNFNRPFDPLSEPLTLAGQTAGVISMVGNAIAPDGTSTQVFSLY
jgi:hypothetical protein